MTRDIRVAILGSGSWGTSVASLAANNVSATLWARRQEVAEEVNEQHTNCAYLPDIALESSLRATSDLEEAVWEADVVVVGVPSHGFRSVLEEAAPHVRPWVPIVSLSKGLERDSRRRMTEVISEVLPGHPAGLLAGPNLAREVMEGYAAATVVAMADEHVAHSLQDVFANSLFRVYTNTDVIGCELGGALKNVVAIAVGMGEGLGVGDNTRSMVITRGLAELTRLGMAMGGEARTFAGLTGMGDLLATCISPLSRNRTVGEKLGEGKTIEEVNQEMDQVAEGVKTCGVVMELARELECEMPIATEVDGVVNRGRTAEDAFEGLRRIQPTSEIHGVA